MVALGGGSSPKETIKFEDISVTSGGFGSAQLSGYVTWLDGDHTYAQISGVAHFADGSDYTLAIIKNYNDIKKDQKLSLGGSYLYFGQDKSLSDVKSIDFKDKNKVVYTWNNTA
ncbi:MAG: hypothetical protein LBB45_09100 [Methanobrevibacter sp.]|jgi:hypothetical protein|nr:hypothetical protein [Candidatus Methanovirga basalitermitum]